MTDVRESAGSRPLPEFERPPVVEVALGIQFRPIPQLRPIELGRLRDEWRDDYPILQEQPPLPPASEDLVVGAPSVQLTLGPAPQARLWFSSVDQERLVQLQPDRLIVNWRQRTRGGRYPRYPSVRGEFERRLAELVRDLERRDVAPPAVTQAEITYINALDVQADAGGQLERFVKVYQPAADHHLGAPEQARLNLVFRVPEVGRDPVRMYVSLNPARRPDGEPAIFLTFTVRGAPLEETGAAALAFMDRAHDHVVRSFAELTSQSMHSDWGMRQ